MTAPWWTRTSTEPSRLTRMAAPPRTRPTVTGPTPTSTWLRDPTAGRPATQSQPPVMRTRGARPPLPAPSAWRREPRARAQAEPVAAGSLEGEPRRRTRPHRVSLGHLLAQFHLRPRRPARAERLGSPGHRDDGRGPLPRGRRRRGVGDPEGQRRCPGSPRWAASSLIRRRDMAGAPEHRQPRVSRISRIAIGEPASPEHRPAGGGHAAGVGTGGAESHSVARSRLLATAPGRLQPASHRARGGPTPGRSITGAPIRRAGPGTDAGCARSPPRPHRPPTPRRSGRDGSLRRAPTSPCGRSRDRAAWSAAPR